MKHLLNWIFFLLFSTFSNTHASAQTGSTGVDSVSQRIFLIGDAGELKAGAHPVVDWLKKNVDWNDERNMAIYLGDNIYPLGLPAEGEPSYAEAKKIIDYQIGLTRGKKAKAYFIPGNHDWKNGKLGGWQQVLNQVNYINGQELPNVQAWPLDGCPGPIEIEVSDKVVVVLMDSQWFLYVHEKPGPGSNCDAKTIDEFATELREIIATHPNQLVVLAMHHPMYSSGVHGGDFGWKTHIFPFADAIPGLYIPLPVLGSIYPVARGVFGNIQDIQHPLYRNMARTIEEVIKEHPNVIVTAGHDHSLQLIRKDSIPYIVSGSGSNLSRVKKNKLVEFEDLNYGFAFIEVRKSGKVALKFYNVASKDLSTPTHVGASKPIVITEPKSTMDTLRDIKDSATVMANARLKGNAFKRFFMGESYRKEWTTPVTVPVLDLAKEYGGLKPKRQGGGKQTKTLRVEDSTGKEWVLRSIEKFPEAAIPADLRGGLAKDMVEDALSGSYPFASLSMAPIARASGVPSIRRKLVYVPDDPRLERFRSDFHNRLAILEEREPQYINKTYNTNELVLRLQKDNDDHVDQKAVLKARLMDNFTMDLDRHEDQWRWATRDTGKGKIYFPIPRDHDQAFYVNQGLIPRLARKPWYIPELQGFRPKAINIETFNKAARNFDRSFLNELSEDDWSRHIDTFVAAMTDSVIERALHNQPREIQHLAANKIMATLKKRRQFFKKDMLEYYRFISETVSIPGSNNREQFIITKGDGGTVHVVVNKIDKQQAISSKIYDRVFEPAVTKELQLYGLNDDDRFIIEGGDSPIKIRVIGGSGKDEFINNGTGGKVLLYDASFEENTIRGNGGLHSKISGDPQVNRYNRLNFKYDYVNPAVSVAYNIDDGIYIGGRVEALLQGFRKEPYGQRHSLVASRALKTSSYYFRYDGDFTKALGRHDLLVRLEALAPINVTNFFGLGNRTGFDKGNPKGEQYYRTRYDVVNASVLLRRQLQSWMRVSYGPTAQYFYLERDENVGHYVSSASAVVLDSANRFRSKALAGMHASLDIDSRNNPILPTRGLLLNAGVKSLYGLNNYTNSITRLQSDMRVFMSVFSKPRLVLGVRFGAAHNFGTFDIPQAAYLSGVDNLRGYRRNRFGGRTVFYNNAELRFRAADFSNYLFAGSFGLHVFHDVGRVWMDNESSRVWHTGWGGGVWLAPVRRFVVTASLAHSKEEKALPLVTFGFQF
jgi:hypothetical protein